MTREWATAFVPGHVTAFFSAHPADSPAAAGSRGAGLTLTDGVETTVELDGDRGPSTHSPSISLNGAPAAVGAVEDVLAAFDIGSAQSSTDAASASPAASVAIETDLPVGAGFGVSGAAALGTALAANAAADAGRSENELVRIAHEAEVERGTGLGDVVAQARGGIPIRLEPGAPGHGDLDGIPAHARVEYVTFGERSTEAVLAGDTTTLSAAGERALDRLRADPRLSTLMTVSRGFAQDADLLVPEVADAIEAVDDATDDDAPGAAMAMLGRTVFSLGTGLSDAGYDPTVCHTHAAGARLVDR